MNVKNVLNRVLKKDSTKDFSEIKTVQSPQPQTLSKKTSSNDLHSNNLEATEISKQNSEKTMKRKSIFSLSSVKVNTTSTTEEVNPSLPITHQHSSENLNKTDEVSQTPRTQNKRKSIFYGNNSTNNQDSFSQLSLTIYLLPKKNELLYNDNKKLLINNLHIIDLFQEFKTWVELKDRMDRNNDKHKDCFQGKEVIEEMMKRWELPDKEKAIDIGNKFIENDLISITNPGIVRNIFRDGPYFYNIFPKKNIFGMSVRELFNEFKEFVKLREKIEKDGEIYQNVFYGFEGVDLMLEHWEITRDMAIDIGNLFIEEKRLKSVIPNESNVFRDSKSLYIILKSEEENMINLLEKFANEYDPMTVSNAYIDPDIDYNSFPINQGKPNFVNLIEPLTYAIQKEYVEHGSKRQFERDAKLWRTTLRFPQNMFKRDLLRRIFTILRFGPFFMIKENGECVFWYETGLPISVALSHGSRIMIQTPPNYDPLSNNQHEPFWNWLMTGNPDGDLSKVMTNDLTGEDCEKNKKNVFKRLAATHGISRGYREKLKGGFIKYIKEERTSGISLSKSTVLSNEINFQMHSHWAINIPLGGYCLSTILGEKISANGEHGHLYIYHLPAEERKPGGILIGLEGSEFNKWDQTGHKHNINATSSMLSPTYGFKWADNGSKKKKNLTSELPTDLKDGPKRYDGMFVDLSQGYDEIMEIYSKWDDDWVMETSVKPLALKMNPNFKEIESEEKLEIIKLQDGDVREKIEMYKQFIRDTTLKKDMLMKQVEKEEKCIKVAEARVEILSNELEWISREEMFLKIQELMNENESLKKKLKEQGILQSPRIEISKSPTQSPNTDFILTSPIPDTNDKKEE